MPTPRSTRGVARSLTRRTLVAAGVAALLLTGCAGEASEPVAAPTVSAAARGAGPTEASEEQTGEEAGPSDEEAGALEPDVAVREVEVSVVGGAVTPPPGRVEVTRGDRVRVTVSSDEADEVHVHGYDLEGAVGPGQPFVVEFVADADGQYEVETHDAGLLLFQLLVR